MKGSIKKIYIDMDGVLADFDHFFNSKIANGLTYYVNMPDREPEFKAIKKDLVKNHQMFANLLPMKDSKLLVNGLIELSRSYGFELEVLTAVGGYETELAAEQKKGWLEKNFPELTFGYCVRSSHKALKADQHSVLIDDRKKCIIPFTEAGGIGILHNNAIETLTEIKKLLHLAHQPVLPKL